MSAMENEIQFIENNNDFERTIFIKYIVDKMTIKLIQLSDTSNTINKTINFKNYNLLYKDNKYIIIKERNNFNNLIQCVIKDNKYENKYLILFTMDSGCTTRYIYGYIVYFDDNNNINKQLYIKQHLFDYDWRDCWPSNENIYMYDDNILFLYTHRDTHTYFLKMCKIITYGQYDCVENMYITSLFDSSLYGNLVENELIKQLPNELKQLQTIMNLNNNDIDTEKEINKILSNMRNIYSHIKNKQYVVINVIKHENRNWINLNKDNKLYVVIDIGSFIIEKNRKSKLGDNRNILLFSTYATNDYNEIINKPEQITEITEYQGYPLKCIKCGAKTTKTIINIVIKDGYSTTNVGNSYCHNCKLRYSQNDKVYYCCLPVIINNEIKICYNILNQTNNYQCDKNHENIEPEYIIQKSYYPPYLDIVRLYYKNLNTE